MFYSLKRYFLILIFCIVSFTLLAQIKVESFAELTTDTDARINHRLEDKSSARRGDVCAIIKVVTTDMNFTFDIGSTLTIAKSEKHQEEGEIWLWVPVGTNKLKIAHARHGQLDTADGYFHFPQNAKSASVYRLRLHTNFNPDEDIIYEEKNTVQLTFHVVPEDATVIFRKIPEHTNALGSLVKTVFPGQYHYRVSADRYHEYDGIVDIPRGSIGNTDVNIHLHQAWGWLSVLDSNAFSEATCFIDGNHHRRFPTHLELTSGTHAVRIERANYEVFEQTINIEDSTEYKLQPLFTPILGRIEVRVNEPDATVKVDGKEIAANQPVDIITGEHTVEISKPNFRTEQRSVSVRRGETASISVNLLDLANFVISSTPSASLTINGKNVGSTPYSFEGSTGTYDIKLECRRYETYHKNVQLRTSDPNLNIRLARQYAMPTSFYLQGGIQAVSLTGATATIGTYIHNVNLEVSAVYGFDKSETIYWNYPDGRKMPEECVYKPMVYGGKIGYGFIIGHRFRLTPQVGMNIVSIKNEDGRSSGYALSAAAGLRADFAVAGNFGLYVAPEYDMSVSKSDIFNKVSVVSSKIDGWANGVNVRAGVSLFF